MKRRPTIFISITLIILVLLFYITATGCDVYDFFPKRDKATEKSAEEKEAGEVVRKAVEEEADRKVADTETTQDETKEDTSTKVIQLEIIPEESGVTVPEEGVYTEHRFLIGRTGSNKEINSYSTYRLTEEVKSGEIKGVTVTLNFGDTLGVEPPGIDNYFGTFPENAELVIGVYDIYQHPFLNGTQLNPFTMEPPIVPKEGGGFSYSNPETEEVIEGTPTKFASIPCKDLKQETVIELPNENVEELKEILGAAKTGSDLIIFHTGLEGAPENSTDITFGIFGKIEPVVSFTFW